MKYLIILSAFLYSATSNHLDNGAYSYQYSTDQVARSEIRHPNGHITGAYQYLDNTGLHQVKYVSEADNVHQVVSHNIYDGEVFPKNVYHKISYRRNLDEPSVDEFPPVYVRHVPSPVKNEPIVPIIDVTNPFNSHQTESLGIEEAAPARRTFEVPSRKSFDVNSAPVISYHVAPAPKYLASNVQRPIVPVIEVAAPLGTQHHFIPAAPARSQISYEYVVPKYVAKGQLSAAQVPLTPDGLTYEVAKARDEHFAAVAAAKANLPPLH